MLSPEEFLVYLSKVDGGTVPVDLLKVVNAMPKSQTAAKNNSVIFWYIVIERMHDALHLVTLFRSSRSDYDSPWTWKTAWTGSTVATILTGRAAASGTGPFNSCNC